MTIYIYILMGGLTCAHDKHTAMQGTASATCQGDDRVIVDYQLHLSSQKWWSEAEACATSICTSYCTADTFSQSTHGVQTGV